MPTEKIADEAPPLKEFRPACHDEDHEPATMIVREPGTYKHTCRACGQVTIFTVGILTW